MVSHDGCGRFCESTNSGCAIMALHGDEGAHSVHFLCRLPGDVRHSVRAGYLLADKSTQGDLLCGNCLS